MVQKFFYFRNKHVDRTTAPFTIGNSNSERVNLCKYPGIDLGMTAEVLCKSGNKTLGVVIIKYNTRDGLGSYILNYSHLIFPTLDYSIIV